MCMSIQEISKERERERARDLEDADRDDNASQRVVVSYPSTRAPWLLVDSQTKVCDTLAGSHSDVTYLKHTLLSC